MSDIQTRIDEIINLCETEYGISVTGALQPQKIRPEDEESPTDLMVVFTCKKDGVIWVNVFACDIVQDKGAAPFIAGHINENGKHYAKLQEATQ